jgi:hypothetical protein
MRGGQEKIQLESVLLELLELNDIDKSQISSTKLQINLNFQYSMTKTGLKFGIWVLEII